MECIWGGLVVTDIVQTALMTFFFSCISCVIYFLYYFLLYYFAGTKRVMRYEQQQFY